MSMPSLRNCFAPNAGLVCLTTAQKCRRTPALPSDLIGPVRKLFDIGQPAADYDDGGSKGQVGDHLPQQMRAFQFGYRISEFGCARRPG